MKWFQISAVGITLLFSGTMVAVVFFAYLKPSGYRKIDVISMQEARMAKQEQRPLGSRE